MVYCWFPTKRLTKLYPWVKFSDYNKISMNWGVPADQQALNIISPMILEVSSWNLNSKILQRELGSLWEHCQYSRNSDKVRLLVLRLRYLLPLEPFCISYLSKLTDCSPYLTAFPRLNSVFAPPWAVITVISCLIYLLISVRGHR